MDALKAYHSSDSEDETVPHPNKPPNDVETFDINKPLDTAAKLPPPYLDFNFSKRQHGGESSDEAGCHPLLPWSGPPRRNRKHDLWKQQVSAGNQTSAVNSGHMACTSVAKTEPSMHNLSLASSAGARHKAGERMFQGKSDVTWHTSATSKRQAVIQPYVPKRLRPSPSRACHADPQSPQGEPTLESLKETMYITQPVIACQMERHLTSKLPKHKTFQFHSHTGPVTCIRWCRPQFSHLLLSSSMDKTVRIWNGIGTVGCCLQIFNCHRGAVKDAQFTEGGRRVLSCGFDKTARLCDVDSGKELQVFEHPSYATCIKTKRDDPSIFITGTYNSSIFCWDIRTGQNEQEYRGKLGQILDLEFLPGCEEFVSSCDVVSRDSANRTIMVWDLRSTAVVSNQLYHEKYTCPCLRRHPSDSVFVAQSTANYIALFSTVRPYKMNKFKRYEGHQLEGYRIGCDFSPDGTLLNTGSCDGRVYVYDYRTSRILKTLQCHAGPCTDVAWHPVLPGVMASCSWDGAVHVWQ